MIPTRANNLIRAADTDPLSDELDSSVYDEGLNIDDLVDALEEITDDQDVNKQNTSDIIASDVQEQIAFALAHKDLPNVKVNAVAGSGKTTTIGLMMQYAPLKSYLIVTYNRRLCDETKQKFASKKELRKVKYDVRTYHSLANRYFDKCYNDDDMERILKKAQDEGEYQVLRPLDFDVIIFDEVQDMTPLLHQFSQFVIQNNQKLHQLVMLGDSNQCIYEYKEADSRFLSMCETVFANGKPWKEFTMDRSFRVPTAIASMVRALSGNRTTIFSHKEGPMPQLISYQYDASLSRFTQYFEELIDNILIEHPPEEIFIISYTVKDSKRVEADEVYTVRGILEKKQILYHIPRSDGDAKSDDRLVKNKIVFSSYEQAKGRERDVVIVLNFTGGIIQMFQKNQQDTTALPNKVYVGLTRAKQKLYVFMRTADSSQEQHTMKEMIKNDLRLNSKDFESKSTKNRYINDVSGGIIPRHLPGFLKECASFFDVVCLSEENKTIVDVIVPPKKRKMVGSCVTDLALTQTLIMDDFIKSQIVLRRTTACNNLEKDATEQQDFTFIPNTNVEIVIACSSSGGKSFSEDVSSLNGDLVTLIHDTEENNPIHIDNRVIKHLNIFIALHLSEGMFDRKCGIREKRNYFDYDKATIIDPMEVDSITPKNIDWVNDVNQVSQFLWRLNNEYLMFSDEYLNYVNSDLKDFIITKEERIEKEAYMKLDGKLSQADNLRIALNRHNLCDMYRTFKKLRMTMIKEKKVLKKVLNGRAKREDILEPYILKKLSLYYALKTFSVQRSDGIMKHNWFPYEQMLITRRNLNVYFMCETRDLGQDIIVDQEVSCEFSTIGALGHLKDTVKKHENCPSVQWLINKLCPGMEDNIEERVRHLETLIQQDSGIQYCIVGMMDFLTHSEDAGKSIIHEIKMKTNDNDYVDYLQVIIYKYVHYIAQQKLCCCQEEKKLQGCPHDWNSVKTMLFSAKTGTRTEVCTSYEFSRDLCAYLLYLNALSQNVKVSDEEFLRARASIRNIQEF